MLAFCVLGRPPLAAADQESFAKLQRKLADQWKLIATRSKEEQSVVVAPSLSMDLDLGSAQLQAYEERFLFLLLLLRLPRMRVVYLTSQPILPDVVDYYLGLLAGVVPSSAATQTGVVFHMLAALSERGLMGLTAVGDSPAQARELFDRTIATLDEETAGS